MPITWVLRHDNRAEVTAKLEAKLAIAVEQTIRAIEAKAKAAAPVRTGFLRNSIGSEMTGRLEGRVHADAEYAPYVNFGTRSTAPNPFFSNAVESERGPFKARLEEAGRGL